MHVNRDFFKSTSLPSDLDWWCSVLRVRPVRFGMQDVIASATPLTNGPAENIRNNPPVLMNEREVALFLDICPRSVRNFTSRKLLPVIRLGRRRLYRRDAVLAALKTMECGV